MAVIRVIRGFCTYIVPGILVLGFWKPESKCALVFDDNGPGTTVTRQVKGDGEGGMGFYNEIAGLLM